MAAIKFAKFRIQPHTVFILAGWTAIMAILLTISWNGMQTHILEIARTEARTSIAKDILYREWNSKHGGVYVLVTGDTQPNPYLNVPERDIFTPSGKLLTLVNPAYMNRQVFKNQDNLDIHAHLTSLNPINPNNEADPWEKESLRKFENGMSEVSSVEGIGDESSMRLMIPFITTEACLKCHATQGYEVGDIRGGLSVSIPLSKYAGLRQSYMKPIAWGYGTMWLMGLAGIVFTFQRLNKHQQEREAMLVSLQKSHAELEVSESKFSKLFQFSPALIMVSTLQDGKIIDVNNKFLERFDFTRDETIGKTILELGIVTPQDRDLLKQELLAQGSLANREITFHKKDGSRMMGLYNGEIINVEEQCLLLSLVQDITTQKETETLLRESEASLRFAQMTAHVGQWTWDTQTNKITWSEEMKEFFGLGADAFDCDLNQVIEKAIHPDDREKVHSLNRAVVEEQKTSSMEYRVVWPDGSIHTIWAAPARQESDAAGTIIRLTGIVQDITDRKQVEESLREHETLLMQAQHVANLGYYLMDIQSGIWKSSDILDGIFGINKDYHKDVQGWAGIVHPDEREGMVTYFSTEVLGEKKNFDREYRIMRIHDGAVRWVHGLGELGFDAHGNAVRMVGTIQDITERKQAEESLRLSEERFRNLFDEMMDGFSLHEIICDDMGKPVDYRFLAINPAFEKLTGLQSSDILGKTVLELMPETEKVWIERYGHVALTGIPDQFEEFSAAFNTYYEVRAFSPAPNHFAVIFHDISQRKFAENITLARMKIVEIATTHSLDTLLQTILDEAERLTGSCIGFYHFLDSDQKTVSLQNWSTRTLQEFCQATGKGMHYPVDKAGVWVDCIQARKPVIHNDYISLPHRKGLPDGHAKIVREMVVPVMRGDRIVAILGVGNKPTDYTHRDVDIVEQLADLAIEIVERKRSEKEIIEKNADLAALFSISAHLRTASNANEMMPVVLQQMGSVLTSDANAVILLEPGDHSFVFALADGALESNTGTSFDVENSISHFVLESRHPYITTDFANDPNRSTNMKGFEHLGPAMLVPLQSETEFIGCLLCARFKDSRKGDFSDAEIQLLVSIGEMVGTALRRSRLYDDALLRLKRVQGLRAIDAAMTTNMDINVTLNILVTQALTLMGMDAANVLTFNPITRTLNHAAGQGFHSYNMESVQLRLGEGAAGQAALECKTISVPDISSETDVAHKEILKREGFQSMFVAPMVTKGQMRGVLELFSRKPYRPDEEWLDFLEALATQAAIAIDASQLYKDLQRSHLELSMAYDATIEGWSHALDLKDKETEGHTLRVTDWTIKLASLAGMSEAEIVHIRRGALLHDIGKMGVPDHILGKTGKLTPKEWEIMRQHPVYGYNMIRPIEFLRPAVDIPYCHHEKWDGTGYPRGLKAEQIPYAARLFAIVDVWDAITSDRPYRKAWSFDEALEYVRSERGRQFDPQIVDLFLQLVDELKGVAKRDPLVE